jgi:positive regulator of sigma E activity
VLLLQVVVDQDIGELRLVKRVVLVAGLLVHILPLLMLVVLELLVKEIMAAAVAIISQAAVAVKEPLALLV